ncbi:MAG: 3-hydroxyacyl-CoA dehydrogenase family protein [Gemmatimonadales bacterium]
MSEIRTVAVVGAGTMGHGIAQAAAQAGCTVRLADAVSGAAEQALVRIRKNLDGAIERGKLTAQARDEVLARIAVAQGPRDAARGADLVIEAVPEQLELKRELFREIESAAPAHSVLATNTSSLSVGAIAAAVKSPARVIGMHFFNPVHIMKLVEIVVHETTGQPAREGALALVRAMGKEPIVVKDSPGFASSRLGIALGLEAMRMLEAGVASAEDIDKAMMLGYNHPMGPLRLTDLVGLDVRLAIARYLHETLDSPVFRPPAILERMVAEGRLGKKSGRGFYSWADA